MSIRVKDLFKYLQITEAIMHREALNYYVMQHKDLSRDLLKGRKWCSFHCSYI